MNHNPPSPPSLQCKNCKCEKCIKYYATYEARIKQRREHEKQEEEKKSAKKREKEVIAKKNDELHLMHNCKKLINIRKKIYSYHQLPYGVNEERRCRNKKINNSDYCKIHVKKH